MHIALIASRVRPQAGGAFTFEHELLEAASRCGEQSKHQFSVVFRDGSIRDLSGALKAPAKKARRARLQALMANSLNNFSKSWRRQVQNGGIHWLDFYLKEIHADVAWFLSPATRPVNTPFFTTVWDLQHRLQPFFPEVTENGEWGIREAIYQQVLSRSTGIFTGTQVGQGEIASFYQIPQERIHVLAQPTPSFALQPPEVDDQTVLKQFGLQPNYLFYPAQFWPHKNHVGLLSALQILREQQAIKIPLVLVGSDKGNRNHVQQAAVRMGLEQQVHFLDFVSREQLIALYRQAKALAFVSFFGPDNLPPLEAFALGCPVIAAQGAGAHEQLGTAAMIVDSRRPGEIAAAIARICSDSVLRAELIERGRARAVRFTGNDYFKRALEIIGDFQSIRQCWD